MKESTIKLYNNVITKLAIDDYTNIDLIINKIDLLSSNSYKLMACRALFYKEVTNESLQAKYKELQLININYDNVGVLPLTLHQLKNIEVNESKPLKKLVRSMVVWINTHRPLRLDYYNVKIYLEYNNSEENYMIYNDGILTFYLNAFKNVKTFGKQIITYDHQEIRDYIEELTLHFGHLPEYFLWQWTTTELQPFSSREMYSRHIQDLMLKYTNKKITMNTIRKIHESDLIQSPLYSKMTNREKEAEHSKLLHKGITANKCYNVIISEHSDS